MSAESPSPQAGPAGVPLPSETTTRLQAMVKRSAELAAEMKATMDKMQVLSDQLAREAARAEKQAKDARKGK